MKLINGKDIKSIRQFNLRYRYFLKMQEIKSLGMYGLIYEILDCTGLLQVRNICNRYMSNNLKNEYNCYTCGENIYGTGNTKSKHTL